MSKSGHGLIGDEELGLGRHRASELEFAHFHLREVARQAPCLVAEADLAQKRRAAILDLVRTVMTAAPLCDRVQQRNAYIVGKGKTDEWPRQLETARQSEMRALMGQQSVKFLAGKTHRALLVAQRATDAIHKCALAGSIGADQPEPLAGKDCERNIFERDEAAEAFAQTVDSQKRLRRSALRGGLICAAEISRAHGTFPGISASTRRRPTKSSGLRCR